MCRKLTSHYSYLIIGFGGGSWADEVEETSYGMYIKYLDSFNISGLIILQSLVRRHFRTDITIKVD